MSGKRKVTAFYVTTSLIFILHIVSFIANGGRPFEMVGFVSTYSIIQGTLTGAFFGFNFGEHWAQARGGK